MSGRRVGLIIVLIISSLVGLVLLQAYFLNNALAQKRDAFRAGVMSALNTAVRALESGETARSLFGRYSIQSGMAEAVRPAPDSSRQPDGSLRQKEMVCIIGTRDCSAEMVKDVKIVDGKLHFNLPEEQHMTMKVLNSESGEVRVLVDTVKSAGSYCVPLHTANDSLKANAYSYRFARDSATVTMQIYSSGPDLLMFNPDDLAAKDSLLKIALNNLVAAEWQPIEERLSPQVLDSVIEYSLKENGIELDYAFGVMTGGDSLRIVEPPELADNIRTADFSARLFPNDVFAPPAELRLYFPGAGSYLFKQASPLLIITALFMMIIVGCFYYTVRTIIFQKIFAGRLVDFINNMTHEFKTPISSISLAAEAIGDPQIISDREKVARYNQIIREENMRMKSQVEKILQIALIEKGEFELELTEIDLQQLLLKIIDSIMLRVENRDGIINTVFNADNHLVKGDRTHLTNIILNILDNSIKYSPEKLKIDISTREAGANIIVGIRDRGMGITESAQKLVFDKYYRVPSGNIHEVKGFGLGLNYVKLMMRAHGGTINLESKPGEGTLVELGFPVLQNAKTDGQVNR